MMAEDSNPVYSRTDEDRISERLFVETVLNWRRRYALYYLSERSGPVPVEELAAQVAAWERATTSFAEDASAEGIPSHTESVSASLRETDLLRLDELGLVTYDRDDDRATGKVEDPTVALFVTNDPRTTVAWHKVYLVLTAVSTVLVGLTQVGLFPSGNLDPTVAAGVVVTLFGVASIAYWYDVRRWRRRNEDEPPDFLVSLGTEIPFEERREDGAETDDGTGIGDGNSDGNG